jgi:hypothetical protein
MKPNKKQSKTRSKKVRFPTKIHDAYSYPEPIEIIAIEKGNDGVQLPIWLGRDFTTSQFYREEFQSMILDTLKHLKGDMTQGKNGMKIRVIEKALVRYYWNALRDYNQIANTVGDDFDDRAKAIFDIGNLALMPLYLRAKLFLLSGGSSAHRDLLFYLVRHYNCAVYVMWYCLPII